MQTFANIAGLAFLICWSQSAPAVNNVGYRSLPKSAKPMYQASEYAIETAHQPVQLINLKEELEKLKSKLKGKKEDDNTNATNGTDNSSPVTCRPNIDVVVEFPNKNDCAANNSMVWLNNKTNKTISAAIDWTANNASGNSHNGAIGGLVGPKSKAPQHFCAVNARVRQCTFE